MTGLALATLFCIAGALCLVHAAHLFRERLTRRREVGRFWLACKAARWRIGMVRYAELATGRILEGWDVQ